MVKINPSSDVFAPKKYHSTNTPATRPSKGRGRKKPFGQNGYRPLPSNRSMRNSAHNATRVHNTPPIMVKYFSTVGEEV